MTGSDGGAALFVGLCTLDVIQLVDRMPGPDEKVTALQQTVAAGGPATNAAVTYRHLGGAATLLTGIGHHPLATGIHADLADFGVRTVDLDADRADPPTLSSVLVTAGTGERAVVSTNAVGRELTAPDDIADLVRAADAVELDGHHLALARTVAEHAARAGRLTVFDGGSWKPGTEQLLPLLDVAVCSADFHPPGTDGVQETLEFLRAADVRFAAVTGGAGAIVWQGPRCGGEVAVPAVRVADTLGAGDVLHGALIFALTSTESVAHTGADTVTDELFAAALGSAAQVAARSCGSFGTRAWTRVEDTPPIRT